MASKRKHTPIRDPVFLDSRRLVIRYGGVNWNIFKTLIFTVVFPGTVAVYIPYRLRGPDLTRDRGLRPVGTGCPSRLAMAVYGGALGISRRTGGARLFRWTHPGSWWHTVYTGFVRNPMYAGVLLVICGQGLLFGSFAIVE